MMIDKETMIQQRIERAMLELVELNNQGVQLLGEGGLELARTAIYHATDRIQQVKDAQAELESYLALRYRHCHHHPLNLVLGVQGRCFVTPLEPVVNDEVGGGVTTTGVDPMTSHAFGPSYHTRNQSSIVASVSDAQVTSREEGRRRVVSSPSTSNESGVVLDHHCDTTGLTGQGPASDLMEVLMVEPAAPPTSTKASSHSSSSMSNTTAVPLVEQQQEERTRTRSLPIPKRSSKTKPLSTTTRALYSFLRPIFFSPQDFLHVVNPPLTHLSICLLFNLAVINHKMVIRIMQSSSSCCCCSSSCPSCSMEHIDDDNHGPEADRRRQRMLVPLQEAIHLYKLAYQLQREEGTMEVSRLHTLGIVNNLGQLLYQAEMYAASKECFDVLLEMITIHRIRDQGSLRRLNHASLFWRQHYHDSSSSGRSEEESRFWLQQQQVQHEQELFLHEQQQQQDGPYMELFLDNIFEVRANPQTSLNAPAA